MGLKFRIHPLAAAIVEQQLDCYGEITAGRERMADMMVQRLGKLAGITPLLPPEGSTSSWYALILRLDPEALGGTGVADIHAALLAEGAVEVDRPGSTRPIPQLPLFQRPGEVFAAYAGVDMPAAEAFPRANAFHESILKLPVWHRAADIETAELYLAAFEKVWRHLERHGTMQP